MSVSLRRCWINCFASCGEKHFSSTFVQMLYKGEVFFKASGNNTDKGERLAVTKAKGASNLPERTRNKRKVVTGKSCKTSTSSKHKI